MKIILLQNVPALGQKYAVKDVADGYAGNFLLPRRLAVVATPALLKDLEQKKTTMAKVAERDESATKALVKKLDGYKLEISAKATEEGTLYAAIGIEELKAAFIKHKLDIGNATIKTGEPLKELGEHVITLQFPHNLEAEVKVMLVPEAAKEEEGKKKKKAR